VHINPDHFLQTTAGRVTTPERNAEAWTQCFAALDLALDAADLATRVYVLVGPQGSGKSTWARQRAADEPSAILFDAILVKRSERKPILTRARDRGIPAIAVWLERLSTFALRAMLHVPPMRLQPSGESETFT
jgi:hypothetical protein